MNTKLAALASALVATAALASAAEAGGGVRLGFGGPLGTFTATPAHGGGSYHRPKLKRTPPAVETARKPAKTQRIARTEPAQAPKPLKTSERATEEKAPVTGSSALIQGTIPPEESSAGTEGSTASDVKAEGEPAAAAPAVASADNATDDAANCKRFIPAVGMTVSVGCDE